jgi:hypothetical protein
MRKLGVLIAVFLTVGSASAQSLKSEAPAPLKKGINKGTADSLVGTQYWYYFAGPGNVRLTVRFKSMGMYGNPMQSTLTVTLYDEKRTWHTTKVISSAKEIGEATFTAEKLDRKLKTIISVAPPPQGFTRAGGDYEIEATGDVQFDEATATGDPIIRTYSAMRNGYGATKFLADGTIETSNGLTGRWKLFDPENHIYTVTIESFRWSVQYHPGYGLVEAGDPSLIVFQELRR